MDPFISKRWTFDGMRERESVPYTIHRSFPISSRQQQRQRQQQQNSKEFLSGSCNLNPKQSFDVNQYNNCSLQLKIGHCTLFLGSSSNLS